jgi:hypothetical protein
VDMFSGAADDWHIALGEGRNFSSQGREEMDPPRPECAWQTLQRYRNAHTRIVNGLLTSGTLTFDEYKVLFEGESGEKNESEVQHRSRRI